MVVAMCRGRGEGTFVWSVCPMDKTAQRWEVDQGDLYIDWVRSGDIGGEIPRNDWLAKEIFPYLSYNSTQP